MAAENETGTPGRPRPGLREGQGMERKAAENRTPKSRTRGRASPLPLPSANGSHGTANGRASGAAAPPEAPPAPAASPPAPAEGRDAGGRFARGNKGGPGN